MPSGFLGYPYHWAIDLAWYLEKRLKSICLIVKPMFHFSMEYKDRKAENFVNFRKDFIILLDSKGIEHIICKSWKEKFNFLSGFLDFSFEKKMTILWASKRISKS